MSHIVTILIFQLYNVNLKVFGFRGEVNIVIKCYNVTRTLVQCLNLKI